MSLCKCMQKVTSSTNFEQTNATEVEFDEDEAGVGEEDLFKVFTHFTKSRNLHSALNDARELDVIVALKSDRHDWCADLLRSVDDLFDPRNSQCDVHRGDASEMEGFQRHLCAWFTNRLRGDCSHRRTCRNECTFNAAQVLVSSLLRQNNVLGSTRFDASAFVLDFAQ